MEGVWESQSCAPMYLVGWVDEAAQTTTGISIPCLLSFLAYQDINATVTGLDAFPQDVWAPVNLEFQVYHLMIDLGGLFILIGGAGDPALALEAAAVHVPAAAVGPRACTIVLAEAATIAGWWTAEIGRQPWIVWNELRTVDAVSPTITGGEVLASLIMFAVLYALLFSLFLFLLNRHIQEGPPSMDDEVAPETLPDTLRDIFARAPAGVSRRGGRRCWLTCGSDCSSSSSPATSSSTASTSGSACCTRSSPAPTTSGGSCSTASARSGTATRSGW